MGLWLWKYIRGGSSPVSAATCWGTAVTENVHSPHRLKTLREGFIDIFLSKIQSDFFSLPYHVDSLPCPTLRVIRSWILQGLWFPSYTKRTHTRPVRTHCFHFSEGLHRDLCSLAHSPSMPTTSGTGPGSSGSPELTPGCSLWVAGALTAGASTCSLPGCRKQEGLERRHARRVLSAAV